VSISDALPSSSPDCRGWSSESACRACWASRASITCSTLTPACRATCAAVGISPVAAAAASLKRWMRSASSWSSRGTRTDQP
jgi:hypothetical protein